MKKLILLLLCSLFISCFTEPKKEVSPITPIENKTADSEFIDYQILDTVAVETSIDTTALVSEEIINTQAELDKIYLGKHLFHQGGDGTFGKAIISKKNNIYFIIGEHKMINGDWIKIEGEILNPSINKFTFSGKISAYSPSSALIFNKYRNETENEYKDDCIWEGETEAIKPTDRTYWRFKNHGCYPYTTDLDIFHN